MNMKFQFLIRIYQNGNLNVLVLDVFPSNLTFNCPFNYFNFLVYFVIVVMIEVKKIMNTNRRVDHFHHGKLSNLNKKFMKYKVNLDA
jgi:hypothetical protein